MGKTDCGQTAASKTAAGTETLRFIWCAAGTSWCTEAERSGRELLHSEMPTHHKGLINQEVEPEKESAEANKIALCFSSATLAQIVKDIDPTIACLQSADVLCNFPAAMYPSLKQTLGWDLLQWTLLKVAEQFQLCGVLRRHASTQASDSQCQDTMLTFG